jgi:hypothetical protein
MQPDSIRPTARIPNFAFNDDMFIPIEKFCTRVEPLRRERPSTDCAYYRRKPSQFQKLGTCPVSLSMALCPFCRKGATFCQGAGQVGHISHAEAMEMPFRRHKS